MKADSPAQEKDSQLSVRVTKARHDLHNSIGHIVGFSEMWLEEFKEEGLELIFRTAGEMRAQINEGLSASRIEAGLVDLVLLQSQVCAEAEQILAAANTLAGQSRALADELFKSDLGRIA